MTKLSVESIHMSLDEGITHGGHTKHPLSIHSFDKSQEYHLRLLEDLDNLYRDEVLSVHGSPTWVADVNKEKAHSEESPLLHRKLIGSYKLNERKRGASTCDVKDTKYYRPNRTHQYLSSTYIRDQCMDDVNLKHGIPTRTTLLRARQRYNKTPVVVCEERRKMLTQREIDVTVSCPVWSKQRSGIANEGVWMHSFITGARYNGAHCLDTRSLQLYGIYMPRHNPGGYFVTDKQKKYGTRICSSAATDSPISTDQPYSIRLCRPEATIKYKKLAVPRSHQIWKNYSLQNQIPHIQNNNTYPTKVPTGQSGVFMKSPTSTVICDTLLPSVQGISVSKLDKPLTNLPTTRDCATSPQSSSTNVCNKYDVHIEFNTCNNSISKPKPKTQRQVFVNRYTDVPLIDNIPERVQNSRDGQYDGHIIENRHSKIDTSTTFIAVENVNNGIILTASDESKSPSGPTSQIITIPSEMTT